MKGSEAVKKIQSMIDKYGDLEIGVYNNEYSIVDVIDNIVASERDDGSGAYCDAEELDDTYMVIYS